MEITGSVTYKVLSSALKIFTSPWQRILMGPALVAPPPTRPPAALIRLALVQVNLLNRLLHLVDYLAAIVSSIACHF